jgi:large subunit ribosomal protein L24
MKIKKDDNIIVITGKDKGKTGKVLKAFPRENRIVVEGINMKKYHEKPRQQGTKGKVVEMAYPIHVSNVRKETAEPAKPKAKVTKTKKKAAKS